MRTVAEITGQDTIARNICEQFAEGIRTTTVIGPEGSGKSHAAFLAAERVGQSHYCLSRRGDRLLRASPEAMLVDLRPSIEVDKGGGVLLDVAEDFAELIEDGHIPFSRTLRRLLRLKSKKGKGKLFTERQQKFIFDVAAVRAGKHCLLIADNLHLWDGDSFNFLVQIQNGFWDHLYPGLAKVRAILIWTPEQASEDFADKVGDAFGKHVPIHQLGQVGRAEFAELISALGGPRTVPEEILDNAYAVAGGHLLFASQLVALLRDQDPNVAGALAVGDSLVEALKSMLEARLEALGPAADLLCRLLQALCIVGENAGRDDLSCIIPDAGEQLEALIDRAAALGLISADRDSVRIVHDIVRRVFLEFLTPDQMDWHARFAECLRRLRPSDYDRRSIHLAAGGAEEDAGIVRILAMLQAVRNMRVLPGDDWQAIAGPIPTSASPLVEAFQAACSCEASRDYAGGIRSLENAPLSVHPILAAERDYMLARLLLLVRTDASQERALALLDDQSVRVGVEPELCARIEELRIVLLSYRGRAAEARQVEARLRAFYQERSAYDPLASLGENRLRRKSESIHSPRIANDRLRKALAFIDPSSDGSAPRDVLEYLLILNNLGANELVIGDFDAAYQHLTRCFELIRRSKRPPVRRVEIVISNLLVSHHLVRGQTLPIIDDLRSLIEPLNVLSSDGCLIRSNIGALLVASGNFDAGALLLEETAAELEGVAGFSAYSLYFLYSNLAVLRWLGGGNSDEALVKASAAVAVLDEGFRRYASRRLELLHEGMRDGSPNLDSLTRIFADVGPQVGEVWTFHGRPLALSDLQFWTES